MTKYRYRWPITIGVSIALWAGIIFAAKANGMEDATFYGIDRTVCGLQVPQERINKAIVNAARENNWSAEQAVDNVVKNVIDVQNYISGMPLGKVVEYCNARTAR